MLELTVTVEVNFPSGKREIEMSVKKGYDIEECEEGLVVCLNLLNGETHTGIFKGMADEDVKLGSLSGKHMLGYNINWISTYYEEIKAS